MFAPQIVSHVKYKPLVPAGALDLFDPGKVLRGLKKEIFKEIQSRIMQEAFTPAAKKALLNGFRLTIGDSRMVITAVHPAFRPLMGGQKSAQMRWLTKARAPIPIVLDSGEVIFRSATPRSMDNGSWYHPGRKPVQVVEEARVAARNIVKDRLRAHFQQHLQNMARGR